MIGLGIVLVLVILAIGGPIVFTEQDANAIDIQQRFEGPSPEHPFGTDNLGRDIFVRVVLGARISLYIGTLSVAIATTLGVPLGATAGYTGGNLDDAIMRVMDVMMSFPPIVFALVITAVLGPNLTNALIALGVVYTPYFARVTRSEIVSVTEEDFVESAKAVGERDSYILSAEVMPNALAPVIVQASVSMAYAILAAAGLSFLGLGAQPPKPAWGLMIKQSKEFIEQAPWMAIFPGLGIAVTVLAFNLLGDGIREVLNPTLKTEGGITDE
jgi:peptide/nickel transport system permease protein